MHSHSYNIGEHYYNLIILLIGEKKIIYSRNSIKYFGFPHETQMY
jgi:hypothetical protein